MKEFSLHLYLVTDEAAKCRHSLLETVQRAVDGGVTIVQYRSTNPDAGTCYREALPIRDFLASRGVPFIVNNRIDLALALDADGVHIGQRDLPVPAVRAMIGPDRILGLSVSNADQLRAVDAALVDYLGMGPVFPTISKLNAPPVLGVDGFAALASQSPLPVVAIGGLDAERARLVRATGGQRHCRRLRHLRSGGSGSRRTGAGLTGCIPETSGQQNIFSNAMPSPTDLVHAVSADLEKIRETAPLVLSLTNSVVQPLTANLLLAAGAVPAMLNDAEEAVEMLRGGTGALLVNLGTVTREQGAVMQTAVQEANRLDIPWVLDPVAVGALSLRTRLAEQLKERKPRIIRGNASEIMALAGYSSVTKGPESTSSSADALQAARELALHTGAAVLVTGRTDYSTDGRQVISTENGHAMMSRVTGVGCSMGALAAACAAVSSSPLQAAVSTAVLMGIAGEMAFEQSPVPGSFAVSLLDSLYSLSPEEVARRARILPF